MQVIFFFSLLIKTFIPFDLSQRENQKSKKSSEKFGRDESNSTRYYYSSRSNYLV